MPGYKETIKNISNVPVPAGLASTVYTRIEQYEKKKALTYSIASGFCAIVSFLASIYSFGYIGKSLSQSGVGQYFSLIFSDASSFGLFWKEILLSITESLPILQIIIALSIIALFFWSFSRTIRGIRIIRLIKLT